MWDEGTQPPREEHVAAVVSLALAAASAVESAAESSGGPVVVAVDGPSGAGKTTLARGVASALEAFGTVAVVHLDRIYPGWDGLAEAPALLATQVLEPLARGEHAAYRLWSWVRDEWAGTREVAPSRFLVVEGCGASAGPARAHAAVSVFVDADPALRRRRGLERDGETYRPHWQRWADQEAALFAADATKERADLVLDTSTL